MDATGTFGALNDLWKYSPANDQWTWVGGSNAGGVLATYGTQAIPAPQNNPGGRFNPASWTDASGNIWIFGGGNYQSFENGNGELNDLWTFTPATNTWTWIGGSETPDSVGAYGSLGVPAAGNMPGARNSAATWTDASGNLWMFGGWGIVSTVSVGQFGVYGYFDDLWEYNPKTQLWTWAGGSSIPNSSGVYSTQGIPAPDNQPGARQGATSWTDASGNFWLFGGYGWSTTQVSDSGFSNDLWEFNPSTLQWTWISGSNQLDAAGNYGTQGTAASSNAPGARSDAVVWKNSSGNVWLFGGTGYDASGTYGDLNDLWEFNLTTKQWTWIEGSNQANSSGTYGTEGTPAPGNNPAGRDVPVTITDASGNFWLFGGFAANSTGPDAVALNDLWKFNP
jgi:hypothetical protein